MKKALIRLSIVVALTGGTTLGMNAGKAEALGWWRDTFIGRLGTRDNNDYYRAIGKSQVTVPPWNRDDLCRWKFGSNPGRVYGSSAGWNSWDTNCYRSEWRWWWQR